MGRFSALVQTGAGLFGVGAVILLALLADTGRWFWPILVCGLAFAARGLYLALAGLSLLPLPRRLEHALREGGSVLMRLDNVEDAYIEDTLLPENMGLLDARNSRRITARKTEVAREDQEEETGESK